MDTFTKAKRREIMQSVRRKNTRPEELLARLLSDAGVKFEQNSDELPGQPDFVFWADATVVFVNGCFWHGHVRCRKGRSRPKTNRRYWQKKIEKNQRRDRRVARQLRHWGYSVFTIWECELTAGKIPPRLASRLQLDEH